MNNSIKAIVFFLAASVSAHAQTNEMVEVQPKKSMWQLTIGGGVSMPVGALAKTDYSATDAGFSGSGANTGILGSYYFRKHLSFNALLSYQGFSFKGAQGLVDGYKEDFGVDSCTVAVKGRNSVLSFLVGATYTIDVVKKLHVDVRGLLGVSSARLAGHDVFLEDSESGNFAQSPATAIAFSAQAGAAIRYDLTKRLGVAVNADYFFSKPSFEIENTNRINNAGRKIESYNQSWVAVGAGLGVYYRF